MGRLSQYYASMFGWENQVREVARVYQSLPPEDCAKCGIFCMDYHQAGAIDFREKSTGCPMLHQGTTTTGCGVPTVRGKSELSSTANPATSRLAAGSQLIGMPGKFCDSMVLYCV